MASFGRRASLTWRRNERTAAFAVTPASARATHALAQDADRYTVTVTAEDGTELAYVFAVARGGRPPEPSDG